MSYQYEDDFEADEASDVKMTTSEVTTKSNEQETSTEYELTSHKAKPHAGASSEEKKSITSSAEESSPLHVKSSNSISGSSGSKKHVAKGHGSTSHKTNDLSDCVKASSTATSSSHHSASSHEHSSSYSRSSASTSRSSEASLASSVQLESSSETESSTTPHKTTTKHVTKEVHENKSASTQKERSNDHHDDDDNKSDSEYETESSTHENENRVEDNNKPTAMRGESPRIQSRTSVPSNTTNNTNTIISPGKRTAIMDRNGQFLHHSNITSVEVRPTELSSFHGSEDSVSIEDEMCNSITDEKTHNNNNKSNNNKVKGNAPASTNTSKGEGKVESKEATTTTKALNKNTKNESQQKSSLPVKSSLQSSSSSSASYEYEYEEESESASSTPKKENASTNKVEANQVVKEATSSILRRDATQPSTVQRVSAGVQLEESKQNNNNNNHKEVKINAPASLGTRKNQMNSKVIISEVERTKPIISKVHPNGPIPDNCTWVDERGWLEKKIEELKNSVMQYNSQIEAKERSINQAKQQASKTSNNKNTKSEPSTSVPQEAISPQMAQLQNDNVQLENEYRIYYGAVIDVEFLLEQARMQLNVVQDQLRLLKKQRIQLGIRDRRAAHVIEETHTKLPPIEERHWRQVNDGYYGHAQLHKKINQLQRDIEHGQESIYMIKHKCEELESVVHAEHFTQMPLKEFHALKEQHANNLKTIRHLRAAISIYQNAMNKERRGSSAAMGRRGSSFINYNVNSKANSRLNSAAGSHPHGGQHNTNSGLLSNNNNLNYHESNVKGKRQPSARSITSLGLNDELHDEVDSRLIGEQNELKTRQAELYEVMDDLNNKIEQRIAQYNANVEFVKQRTANNNSSTSSMFAATPIHRERKVHQPLSINEVTPERANTSSAAERRKSSARRNTSDNYDIDQLSNKNKKDSSNNKNSNNVNRAHGRNTRKEDELNVANSAIRSRSDSAPIPVQGNLTSRPLHLPELAKAKNINNNMNSITNNTKSKNSEKNSGRVAETKADAKIKNTQTTNKNKNTNNSNKSGRNASLQEENSMSEILEAIDEKNKQIQRDVEREVKKSNDTHVEQTRNAPNRNMKQKEAQQQQHQQQKQHKEEEIKEELSAEEEEEDEEEEYEYEYEEESEEDEGNDKCKKGVTGQVTSNNNNNNNNNSNNKLKQNELASTNSSEISNPFVKNINNNNNNKKTTNSCSAAPVEQPKLQKPLPVNDQKIKSSVDGVKRSGQINNSNNMAKVQPSLSSMASSGRSTPEWLR